MDTQPASRVARAEAAAWIAKLHSSERSAELEADFRSWLDENAEHARAFEHVTQVWDDIGNVQVGGLPRLAHDSFGPPRQRSRIAFALAACLLLTIGIAASLVLTGKHYATDVGEQRVVSLEDGSRIFLNSRSKVRIEFAEHKREVELERGEAFFQVAKDPTKPFVVTAGDRTVTALGTSFVVRYEQDSTAVTLVEGKVAVAPAAAATVDDTVVTLTPGQRVTFEQGRSATIDMPAPDTTAAWRRGEVVLDETPLAAAVAEMNRYSKTKIILDPTARTHASELGTLPISGIYRTGDNQDFANAIATVYNLEVSITDKEIHLRPK